MSFAMIDLGDMDGGEVLEAAIEIGLLWWFFYVVLRFLHGTRGLAIMKGVLVAITSLVLGIIVIAQTLDLNFSRLTVAGGYLLQFMSILLIVMFQPELRRGFTRLAEAGGRGARVGGAVDLDGIVQSVVALSRDATGALIVFEQQTGVFGLEDTGVPLDSALSGPLIESVFYPKSPLHDGAVVVRDGRVVAASCMLPLTDDPRIPRNLGSRHRAAIGVTEESDAVVVIVSEETGTITVCRRGQLQVMSDGAELRAALVAHVPAFASFDAANDKDTDQAQESTPEPVEAA